MPASSDGRAQAVADTPRSLTCRFPPGQVSGKRTFTIHRVGPHGRTGRTSAPTWTGNRRAGNDGNSSAGSTGSNLRPTVPMYYSRGFPICGLTAAQRGVARIGCRLHGVISFLVLPGLAGPGCGEQPGAVVVLPARARCRSPCSARPVASRYGCASTGPRSTQASPQPPPGAATSLPPAAATPSATGSPGSPQTRSSRSSPKHAEHPAAERQNYRIWRITQAGRPTADGVPIGGSRSP